MDKKRVRVVAISDTHGFFPRLPDGEILIHAGDLSRHGTEDETMLSLEWLKAQPHPVKVLVPGNHDLCLQEGMPMVSGIHYLVSKNIDVLGLTIYGHPWTPYWSQFHCAFTSGSVVLESMASSIPKCDILVTHGPPKGVLDRVPGRHAGCEGLQRHFRRARHHVFGHIHEMGGCVEQVGNTTCYNASHVNHRMQPAHEAHVFYVDVPSDRDTPESSSALCAHESLAP